MKNKFGIWIMSLALAACASNSESLFQQQVGLVAKTVPNAIILQIPSTNNPISTGILAASVEMSGSKAAEGIAQNFVQRPDATFAIAGDSAAVNIATLKYALKNLKGQSHATVYIQADDSQIQSLQTLATPKGMTVKALR